MHYINGLRQICGHDSNTVVGCLTCEAADIIERSYRMQKAVQQAYQALCEEEAAYDPPNHHVVEARKALTQFIPERKR